jgi:hypothetical protein
VDGQRNEGNRRFLRVCEKRLKTVQNLGKGRTEKNIKQYLGILRHFVHVTEYTNLHGYQRDNLNFNAYDLHLGVSQTESRRLTNHIA